jgi:ribosomal protein L2
VSTVLTNTIPLSGTEERDGFSTYVKYIRPGSYINTLEFKPFGGAKYIRSGGAYGKLVSLTQTGFAIVKLRSKILLKISEDCVATIGTLRK